MVLGWTRTEHSELIFHKEKFAFSGAVQDQRKPAELGRSMLHNELGASTTANKQKHGVGEFHQQQQQQQHNHGLLKQTSWAFITAFCVVFS